MVSTEQTATAMVSDNNRQIRDFLAEAIEKMEQDIFKEIDVRIQTTLAVSMQRNYWQMQPKTMYPKMQMNTHPFTQAQR